MVGYFSIASYRLTCPFVDDWNLGLCEYLGSLFTFLKEDGSLDVYIQDQTSDIVDYYLCINIRSLTLSSATIVDNSTINVVSATGVLVGSYICIQESKRAFQAKILSINDNAITLDTPLDFGFSTDAGIAERTPNLNKDGSITPISANLKPAPGVTWDITRIIINMTHVASPDDGKFGGIDALTKGIVLRKTDGIHHTIFNAKTNGNLRERAYDLAFSDKAPAGLYGTSARRSFAGQDKNGVTIRLNGDLSEAIEIIIQDNLTGLSSFRIVAQGHVVE